MTMQYGVAVAVGVRGEVSGGYPLLVAALLYLAGAVLRSERRGCRVWSRCRIGWAVARFARVGCRGHGQSLRTPRIVEAACYH